MKTLLLYLHLFGLVASLGSGLFFVLVFVPALRFVDNPSQRMKLLGNSLRYFHPLFLFGICLSFMTGAFRLTDLKIDFGNLYYETFGKILFLKFGFVLAVFLVAGMQCLGMGLKLTRMVNGVIEGDLACQERYARKIWRAQAVNLVLLAVTMWLGLRMGEMVKR